MAYLGDWSIRRMPYIAAGVHRESKATVLHAEPCLPDTLYILPRNVVFQEGLLRH